jgi:hypothetical protein
MQYWYWVAGQWATGKARRLGVAFSGYAAKVEGLASGFAQCSAVVSGC